MNYRVIFLSGVISALLGSMFGWGMGQIALRQHHSQMNSYMSLPYRLLYGRRLIWIGAIASFAIGTGEACVLCQRNQRNGQGQKSSWDEGDLFDPNSQPQPLPLPTDKK